MFHTLKPGAKMLLGTLALFSLSLLPAQATETVLHSFSSSYLNGAYPTGQLAVISGAFYGATEYGTNGYGDLFKMTSTGVVTILREFAGGANDGYEPWSGPIAVSGNLYGTTIYGGASNGGVLYKITPSGTFTVLHSFIGQANSDGTYPYGAPFLASDGNLYGTTEAGGTSNQGSVWQYNLTTNTLTVLHSFLNSSDTAYNPFTGVVEGTDGFLYGTAYNASGFYSGIYKIKKDGTGYSFVHGFPSNDAAGYFAYCDLIKASDGNLYGMCKNGGLYGLGTVFKVVTSTGTVSPVWNFDGYTGAYPQPAYSPYSQNKLIQGADGKLYGVTTEGGYYGYGTGFRLTTAGVCSVLTNFNYPDAYGNANPLVQSGTTFYCTSYYGGAFTYPGSFNGYGAAMSITSTGTIKVLQSFYQRDSWQPYSPVVQDGTVFYGEVYYGGEYGNGLIYKIDSAGHYTVLHNLDNNLYFWEGSGPSGGLLLASDGNLYGICNGGGKYGSGTVFKITTKGVFTVLHQLQNFEGNGGGYGGLTQGAGTDKNLYGTLNGGGPSGNGSIFCTDTAGKNFKIIHYFNSPDGSRPECTPVPDGAGNLFGTCYAGAAHNYGNIWKVSTNGATFTDLYDFDNTHGAYPYYGGKLALVSGVLYGITEQGAANGQGVIFAYNTSTNAESIFHNFNNSNGEGYNPLGGVVYDAASGNLYGCCLNGGASGGYGTLYKINLTSGTLTVLHTFTNTNSGGDGANPYYWPILGTDGFLYGTTVNGGTKSNGTVWQATTTP